MSNDVKQNKRRRRRGGVPTALVILLLIIAVAMGALAGFVIARRTTPTDNRLEQANERIIELENTLNLIGFPMDADPENWVFDDSAKSNAAADLAGVSADEDNGESELWTEDDDILSGAISDDSDPVVVAEFNGGQLLSTEVIPEFNDQLAAQIFAGYSADEVSDSVLQTVLADMAGKKLVALKASEQGLDKLTAEDQTRIDAETDKAYKEQVAYYTAFVSREAGMTQDEINAAAEEYMKESAGVTRESIAAKIRAQLPIQKYYDEVTRDVTVSEAEIKAHYDERLAEQKASYTEYPEEYEYAHIEGATILYNPEGYRRVRDLLLVFSSDEDAAQAAALMDQIARLDPETEAEQIRELEGQLEPLYKPLEATAAEIAEKLKAGTPFMELMDQYGADEVMRAEPMRTEGYYISDNSFLFSTEFIEGAMILEQPGQVSTTLRSASGLHMAEYAGDVTPGDVPLDQVYDAMKAETLAARKDARFEEKTAELLEQANVKYYPERLQ